MKIGFGVFGALGIFSLVACGDLPDEPPWPGSSSTYVGTGSTGYGGSAPFTTGTFTTGSGVTVGAGGSGVPFDGGFVSKIDAGVYDQPVVVAPTPPPPVSGGTIAVVGGGKLAAVADSDRDQVVVVDLDQLKIMATIALEKGDEPGRVIEDGAGRLHVALRGAGAVATIDVTNATVLSRASVCSHPRGLAYQAAGDLVHVACAGGELVSLPAAGGDAVRRVALDRDLR